MTITITLEGNLVTALQDRAEKQDLSAEQLAIRILTEAMAGSEPATPREVVARVKSVLRRSERAEREPSAARRRIGALTIDNVAHEVRLGGKVIELTPTQFKILDSLAAHVGQTLSRDQLLGHVSGDSDVYDRTLDRHIANLRARIEPDPANPQFVVTVFGIGYKMVKPT